MAPEGLSAKAGEGSSQEAEVTREGRCVRGRSHRPGELSKPALLDPSSRSHPAILPCASGSRRDRERLRAGHSARLAAVLPLAGGLTVPAALRDRCLSSAEHQRVACRGGGTATRTMVSALSPAAEAALRWAEVWLPWFSGLERRDGKPFFLRERSESRVEKGWHGGSAAGQLWESPLLPPVPVPQSLATGRPGGPRSLGTLQNLALSISEQGMLRVFVSVPPLILGTHSTQCLVLTLKLHLKRTQKMRDLLNPDLSFLLYPSSVILPSSKR